MFHFDNAEFATSIAILASSSHVHDKSTYAEIESIIYGKLKPLQIESRDLQVSFLGSLH